MLAGFLLLSCAGTRNEQEEVQTFLSSSAGYYLQKGGVALNAGRYQDALESFRQAVKLTPLDPVAYNDLGAAFYHLGELDSAIAACRTSLRLRPDYVHALINLSKACLGMGDLDAAHAAAARVTELQPAQPEGYSLQAEIFDKGGDVDAAIAANRKALELAPDNANLRINLGVLYFHSGRVDQAIDEYQQVLDKDSTQAVACFNLGNALARKCLLQDASAQYGRAIGLQPGMIAALNNHGLIQLFLGHDAEAIGDFRRALMADSNAAIVYYNLSMAMSEVDSAAAARRCIEHAIRLDDRVPNFYLQQSRVMQSLGDVTGAIDALHRALALDSTLASGYNSLANLMAVVDPQHASAVYQKALSLYPDYLQKRYLSANQYVERGFVDLLASCKDAVQITTDYAMVHNNLGKVYLRMKQYDDAVRAFEKAIEVQPGLWEPYENLAVIKFAQKNSGAGQELLARARVNRARAAMAADSLDAAESFCQEAIRLHAANPAAYALLAEIYLHRGQPQVAETALRKGLRQGANDPEIHFAYGKFLNVQGRNKEAERYLRRAIQLDPRKGEMRRTLADVLRALGRDEEAYIQWAESHAAMGREYQAAGFLDRALEEYSVAASLTDQNADFLAAQGTVYVRLKDRPAADSMFTLALKRDPQNHKALYGAGILKGDEKMYGEAIGFLLRALEVKPDDGPTHYALAVNYYFLNDLVKARFHLDKAMQLGADVRDSFIRALSQRTGQP